MIWNKGQLVWIYLDLHRQLPKHRYLGYWFIYDKDSEDRYISWVTFSLVRFSRLPLGFFVCQSSLRSCLCMCIVQSKQLLKRDHCSAVATRVTCLGYPDKQVQKITRRLYGTIIDLPLVAWAFFCIQQYEGFDFLFILLKLPGHSGMLCISKNLNHIIIVFATIPALSLLYWCHAPYTVTKKAYKPYVYVMWCCTIQLYSITKNMFKMYVCVD